MSLTAHEVILRPVISEKSMDEAGHGKYTFAVHGDANKIMIKGAVEELFKVNVTGRQRPDHEGQGEAPGHEARPDQRLHDPLAEGRRHPGQRPEDRILRGGLTMALRTYKPTSPGLRGMTRSTFEEITTREPHKPLLEAQTRGSGRNNQGRLTVRHRGGGEKQHYRRIDFKRDKVGVPARLATIEYDPNRSARIGLLHYRDGEKRYMLLPHGLKVGDVIVSGPGGRGPGRQRPADRQHPAGHHDPQHRADPGQGRPDRPLGRRRRPAAGQGGRLRPGPAAVGRGPPGEHQVHGHDRPGQQPRPREPEPGQGRSGPPSRPAAGSPRRRDEPARPSARRRRGQVAHGHAAQDALGQAGHGPAHPDATRPAAD